MVTYHPNNMKGDPNPTLIYTFSLPNMVRQCNHDLDYDMGEAIDEANRMLNGHDKLPPVRIEEGALYRIDPVYQYQVGDHVQDYVTCISNGYYPHRDTMPYKFQGVAFPSIHETSKFYHKKNQCHHLEAYGYLRHEKTMRGTGYIAKRFGNNEFTYSGGRKLITLLDIDNESIKRELEKDHERLRLNGTMICNREVATEKLMQYYGRTTGQDLIGFWALRQFNTREQMISIYGFDNRTVNKKEKLIQEAGVSMISSEKVTLPPLVIEM
jgi:hypothetical protein